jgi:hypothetical protein
MTDPFKAIKPGEIAVNPDGSISYSDKRLADAVASTVGVIPPSPASENGNACTNGGDCRGSTNLDCNNTGQCKPSDNLGQCTSTTISPPT